MDFIFEVDPKNKTVNKIILTDELKISLCNIYKNFTYIENSHIIICSMDYNEDDFVWYFYPPDIPNSFEPCTSIKKQFQGKCYIVGEIYKYSEKENWRVMRLSSMYHKHVKNYVCFD